MSEARPEAVAGAVAAVPEEGGGALLDATEGTPQAPGGVLARRAPATAFEVHLDVFSGPFDLLLGLISKHKLDITEISLASVTDEFIAHIGTERAKADGWDLSQASEFLLVAATLLDLKASRLLPQLGPEDEDDLALIEARDLLFARLLQYRAFKDIAADLRERMETAGRRPPVGRARAPLAALLPELVMGVTPEQIALIAARALTPKAAGRPSAWTTCMPGGQRPRAGGVIGARLRRERARPSAALVADADSTLIIVARFLALLELFRDGAVIFEQVEALGELTIRWTGPEEGDIEVDGEFDEEGVRNASGTDDQPPGPATATTTTEEQDG